MKTSAPTQPLHTGHFYAALHLIEGSLAWTQVGSLGWEDPREKGMPAHSSIHEQRSLVGCSSWGRKASDKIEGQTLSSGVELPSMWTRGVDRSSKEIL